MVVVDASIAVARLLAEQGPVIRATMERLETEQALVPVLWHFEVRNALLVAERRGRLDASETGPRLRALAELKTTTDQDPDLGAVLSLARSCDLSFYDALYLELAKRRAAPLATLDQALLRAAVREGVAVVSATPTEQAGGS